MENLAPEGADASEFVHSWLLNWSTTQTVNGFPLDRKFEERDEAMQRLVICPWLRRTPANQCDDTCGTCTSRKLDLALAPYRLIAIANRMDQRDEVATAPNGEGRLVFGLADGSGDDPNAPGMPMTVIFEYRLPTNRTVKEWADAWHHLASFPAHDEPYRAALQEVTDAFTSRGANPEGINGSAISQVRTNESALNWMWQLREFHLTPSGSLEHGPLRNTPAEELNGSVQLANFINANAEAIRNRRFEMPRSLAAGSAISFLFRWGAPEVDEETRRAFALQTCNGCHGSEETRLVDRGFHISPFRKGKDKLSGHMFNPTGGGGDEVELRTKSARRALCKGT
jgi:hypothetical protein